MKTFVYEHCWKRVDKQNIDSKTVVDEIQFSKAVAMPRQSPALKAEILRRLQQRGWSGEVAIDSGSSITITSVLNSTGLCFQTGNMARMYADLLKLQTVFAKGVVERGIFIIPTKKCAETLGSNIANFERLTRELIIFEAVITMPLFVVGIE